MHRFSCQFDLFGFKPGFTFSVKICDNMVDTRTSRSRAPEHEDGQDSGTGGVPAGEGSSSGLPGSPPGSPVVEPVAEGSHPPATPGRKRGRPKTKPVDEQQTPPTKKTPSNEEILFPTLSTEAHGLWAKRFPIAAAAYTQLRGKNDLCQEDITAWVTAHSRAFGLYNNLVESDIPSDGEGEPLLDIHANEAGNEFPEEGSGPNGPQPAAGLHGPPQAPGPNGPQQATVSAAAGSAVQGMNQRPADRPQPNFDTIQQDLSRVNMENLVASVNTNPGMSSANWLGKVHDLHGPVKDKSLAAQITAGGVAQPAGEFSPVCERGTYGSGGLDETDVSLLDLGLTEHLSEEIISHIQLGKFVELYKLLPLENAEIEEENKIVTVEESDSSIIVKPKDSRKKITSFGQWSRAWTIYHAVYIDKFPYMSKSLLKYSENMRTIAFTYSKNSEGWLTYDRHFRAKLAKDKSGMYRWDRMDYELLHSKVLIPAVKKHLSGTTSAPSGKAAGGSKLPKGKSMQGSGTGKKFATSSSKKPCRFFNSERGCTFKKSCHFFPCVQ